MKQIQHIILTLLLLLSSLTVFSQSNYPIYVTPTLTPPYSLRLSDYSAVGSQNLMVQINVNDLNITDLPVKLRIKMETAGVSIETPPTITTTPIYLNGGVTSILFGEDLRDYFHINNLVFKGYSKEAYKRSGQLPGGFYKFTVEVLHYNTNRLISNSGTTSVWITLGKPPVLKSPANDEQLGQFQGMPLTFAWLASNVGSPVSSGSIQYTFEMWEMRINGINPNTIAQSMPVFHEEKTFNTFCQIYPATLMLEPGMRYAWRITASDISGYIPFEQNGHSEIRTFMYKATCDSVTHLNAKARGSSATFVWDTEPNHTSFNVELRQPDTGWLMNSETYDNKAEFFELEQGQSYEMRVQAVCNADPSTVSDYSQWTKVKIPVQKPLIDTLNCPTCGCDDNMPQVELTNFDLRTDLSRGDTLSNKTGTTRFIINKAEPQGEGSYTGIFYYWAEIWGIKFVCEYENLQVNTDNVIVNMDFESVYDPQYLLDVDELSDYLNDLADDVANLTTGITVKDSIVYEQDFDAVYVNAGDSLIAVSVDENGNITETTLASSTDDLDKTLVKDKNGDAFVVTGKGEAMGVDEFKATGGNSRLLKKHNKEKESKLANGMVTFKASGDQRYGFDTYCEIKSPLQQHYTPLNNGYRPAWKSLPAYGTDVVAADAYEGITFKDEMGIPAIPSGEKLNLRGSFDGAEVPLYAYKDTSTVAGKLNMVSYGPKTNKLYIVPVNRATLPNVTELKNTLNSIYAQAVMQWDVQAIQEPVQVSFPGGNMTHGGSGSISTYNADQKAIIKAYTSGGRALERNAFYLFFVDNVSDKGSNIAGYMPLQRQCGFIYGNPKLNTIAHELAHGAFNLYHTFSTHGYIAPEGKTQNLMDYTNGATELWKHQWDKIHNPQDILFGFMVDEEEGESIKHGIDMIKGQDYAYIARCDYKENNSDIGISTEELYKYIGKSEHGYSFGTIKVNDFIEGFRIEPTEVILIFSNNHLVGICDPVNDYSNFCSLNDPTKDGDLIAKFEEDVESCRRGKAFELLQKLNSYSRHNQQFELSIGGKVYSLDNNTLNVETISDEDINAGNWSGTTEMKMRVGFNADGILQFTAIGIRKDLPLATGKTATLTDISANMLTKNNALLKEYQVKSVEATPNDVGANLDSDTFPDGKKVAIDKKAAFMKILCEAGGVGLSFLKTAEIERPVYHEVGENTIKAPPIATGTLESVGMIVTDITSLVCTINDLVTDKEVRKKAKDGFVEVGKQVKNDPTQLFPILQEVLIEEVTGSSSEQLAEIQLETTDPGRKIHLVSKAGVSTIKAVIVGGKFISELPEIAMKIATKMTKAKSMLNFKNIDNLAKHLVEEFTAKLKKLPDGGKKFLDDFKDASEDIRRKFLEKPDLVESWKGLINQPRWVRKNTKLLEKISGDPKLIRKVDIYYSNSHTMPGGWKGDPNLTLPRIYKGIEYDDFGFPKLEMHSPGSNSYYTGKLVGDPRATDNLAAMKWLKEKSKLVDGIDFKQIGDGKGSVLFKVNGKWEKCTWHHHQDGQTLIPVIFEKHNQVTGKHTGGVSIITKYPELIGIFK